MIIIGIAGGTGSGKTTVVKSIVDSLPANEVALLPLDCRGTPEHKFRPS